MAYTGDMPQQQKNSGMKTQRANCGCRFCFVTANDRGDLQYDTFRNGRYHKQAVAMREDMNTLRTKILREKYATKWGIDTEEPCLVKISPALDIILSRPGDPAHSEYNGLTRIMHNLLLDTVLTPAAAKSYAATLRSFPFPPTWPRVQGPLHHLKSYSLSEHARWSIVIPVLLRCWLQEKHLRPHLLQILRKEGNPVHQIVQCFAAAATSNCVLMGNLISDADRANLDSIVSDHRSKLQRLLQHISDSLTVDPRRARSRSVSRSPTPMVLEPTLVEYHATGELISTPQATKELAALAQTYLNSMKLPNVHTALHYSTLAEEYGMPANCNVLVGEDKHRYFKKVIYTTNYQHPERDLLYKENMRQTLRLVLTDAFANNELAITDVVKAIYSTCPTLFSTLLPRSEQLSLEGTLIPEDDDDDEDVQGDKRRSQPRVTGCIQAKYCREALGLPTRASHLTNTFSSLLAAAYGKSYKMPNIIIFVQSSTFQWCKKLSFFDPGSQRRETFKMGDFIMEHQKADEIVRIDHILVHTWNGVRRLFVKGTRITASSLSVANDSVLGPGYHRLRLQDQDQDQSAPPTQSTVLIGLPDILPRQLYIIPIAATGAGEDLKVTDMASAREFLWAQRTLQWL